MKLKVLLVEDTLITADQIRELIQTSLIESDVMIARSEDEALTAAEEYEPDVVILDLKLKQGTGFGVLRALAEPSERPVLIVLTNYALPQYREFAKLIGADYFLDKTIDFATLPQILQAIPFSDHGRPNITRH